MGLLCIKRILFSSGIIIFYIIPTLCFFPSSRVSVERIVSENCPIEEVGEDVVDVAVYRNKLIDVDKLIALKQEQREEYDKTSNAIKGVGIGLIGGIGVGAATFFSEDGSLMEAIQIASAITIAIGFPLGLNFASGNKIYVPTEEQARRLLIQDFVDGIWRNGDVAFAARVLNLNDFNGKFRPTRGIVAVCDTQIRNSMSSTRKYGKLPTHVHLMNMSVDEDLRRRGIATKLINAIETYAREEVNAEILTLLVDDTNEKAINLYEKMGFFGKSIGVPNASQQYGSFTIGRSIMIKKL